MFRSLKALGAGLAAATLAWGAAQAAPPAAKPLTAAEKADLMTVLKAAKPGVPMELDMSNPAQYRFFLRQMSAAGITPERYPQLYRVTAAAAHKPPPKIDRRPLSARLGAVGDEAVTPIQTLTSLGTADGSTYAVSALSSVPNNPVFSQLVVQVLDANNNPLGLPASASTATLPASNLNAVATGVSPSSFGPVQGVAAYFWQDQYGHAYHGVLAATVTSAPSSITNLAPMPAAGQTITKLCLARTGSDCTYSPAGGTGTNVLMPVQGSITFSSAISTVAATQSSLITMAKPDAGTGGGCTIFSTSNFFGDPNTQINGGTISWNLPAAQFQAAQGCLNVNATAIYTLTLGLTVGNLPTFVSITSDQTTDPTDPYFKIIPQLQVFWSCVAEGTLVTLADGSTVAVEALKEGQRVRLDAAGHTAVVESKLKGLEAVPMIRLRTAGGRTLLVTEGHPVMTPAGPVLAGLLRPGQKVLTDKGPDALVATGREMFRKHVWNLNVGPPPHDLNDPKVTGSTFLAGGIEVGDNVMQFVENRRHQRALAAMKARSAPPEWRRDIESATEDAR